MCRCCAWIATVVIRRCMLELAGTRRDGAQLVVISPFVITSNDRASPCHGFAGCGRQARTSGRAPGQRCLQAPCSGSRRIQAPWCCAPGLQARWRPGSVPSPSPIWRVQATRSSARSTPRQRAGTLPLCQRPGPCTSVQVSSQQLRAAEQQMSVIKADHPAHQSCWWAMHVCAGYTNAQEVLLDGWCRARSYLMMPPGPAGPACTMWQRTSATCDSAPEACLRACSDCARSLAHPDERTHGITAWHYCRRQDALVCLNIVSTAQWLMAHV